MHLEPLVIQNLANRLGPRLRDHRRTLHRHPEIGFAVHRSAAYIDAQLDRLGVAHRRVVDTGVVAVIPGHGDRVLGLRADVDALPVPEAPGREGYRSRVEGLSHACGHDGHVAVLLGLAELLSSLDELPGTVVCFFQPAEEGPGGAEPMVAAGVLDDPAPDAVLALHADGALPTGVVGVRSGPSSGSDDTVRVTVHGVGGHAAHPHDAVDPVPVAAQIVLSTQALVTREFSPVQPVAVTFGSIHGGTRHNVIPSTVELAATVRSLHQHNRDLLLKRIPEVAHAIASAFRATVTVDVDPGYPVGVNDDALIELIAGAARTMLGDDRVLVMPEPSLGSEDFYAFGSTGLPVAMFRLGVANPAKGCGGPHHSPVFDLDEDALPVGVAVLAEATRRFLTRAPGQAAA